MDIKGISNMSIEVNPSHIRRSSIICTIGPNVMSVEKMTELRRAGMNIVRMNFSHGSHEYHKQVIDNARKSQIETPFGRPLAIALDTKGPEIRTGFMKNGQGTQYNAGDIITITNNPASEKLCDETLLYVDYPGLCKSMSPGRVILVEDGNISFEVVEITSKDSLRAKALNKHTLTDRKNVNLPGTDVDLPAVSEKDKSDLLFGVQNDVDMIFASFIRRAEDVKEIRRILGEKGRDIKIISKIENMQGIKNFDQILVESDGIMVARGDLGMEIPLEKVFVAQKMMIAKCNIAGKPVICATQMLESMTNHPRPTRAEVSDVANAILDGADCVMLSGETAKGAHPLEAVDMMHRCCLEAESVLSQELVYEQIRNATPKPLSDPESVACAAVNASMEQAREIVGIVVLTTSGDSARLLSKYRPSVPIIAITHDESVARQIHLHRGCYPLVSDVSKDCSMNPSKWQDNVDLRIRRAIDKSIAMKIIAKEGKIIVIQGWRGGRGKTNSMRILPIDHIIETFPSETA